MRKISLDEFVPMKSAIKENLVITNHLLDLSQYAGKPFYIAFRHLTEQGVVLVIDNIRFMCHEAGFPVIVDNIEKNSKRGRNSNLSKSC